LIYFEYISARANGHAAALPALNGASPLSQIPFVYHRPQRH
jgi:hypothetical protein